MMDHETHVSQTIDRNTHSQYASIKAIIAEQAELRKVVEDLASRLDRSQETSGVAQNELSTNALLEINALKSKVDRLTEQNTKLEGDVSYLSSLSEHVDACGNAYHLEVYRLEKQVKRVKREWLQLSRYKMKWMSFEGMSIGKLRRWQLVLTVSV